MPMSMTFQTIQQMVKRLEINNRLKEHLKRREAQNNLVLRFFYELTNAILFLHSKNCSKTNRCKRNAYCFTYFYFAASSTYMPSGVNNKR